MVSLTLFMSIVIARNYKSFHKKIKRLSVTSKGYLKQKRLFLSKFSLLAEYCDNK